MTGYVPVNLRREVELRAGYLCEYCLIHERDTYLGCQVDHIVSEKHGGRTVLENLALACSFCNRAKGTDIGSILEPNAGFIRFFNPRADRWSDHFRLQGSKIDPRTDIGAVTVNILRMNSMERLIERDVLIRQGRYPPAEASKILA